MMTPRPGLFVAAAVSLTLATGAWAASIPNADKLPTRVLCTKADNVRDVRASVFATMGELGIKSGPADWPWLEAMLRQGSLQTRPISALPMMARTSFEAEAALVKAGGLVAALMVHDGSMAIDDYKRSPNAGSVKSFLVIAVTPTSDPEGSKGEHGHAGEDDDTNRQMAQIMRRISTVKAGLGPFYSETAAKYFIRGHAYADAVAILAARRVLCSEGLNENQLTAIGLAAEYVKTGRKPVAAAGGPRK